MGRIGYINLRRLASLQAGLLMNCYELKVPGRLVPNIL
jgi:hypothetical protein